MTSRKISQYDAITNVQPDDLLVVVDVHDTSMASSGTTKRMTLSQAATVAAADYAPTGLTGATAASRYVGATASGAPASGTFAVGDFVIDQTGKVWVCTVAGSPGTWVAAGPTIPVTIAQGGTGQTTQQAAMDALAGTQTAAQFLRGNGTHVAMSAIQAGDLASVTNEQGYAPLVLTPSGAFAWGAPWLFYADAYGAKGDGKIFTDGVTNGTTTFISATAGFTSADTGKHIMINGGNGAAAAPVLTTITFVNATTVTLGVAAGASATGCAFVYGTDDTSAINSAISAASTYAQANNFMAEVVFSPKIYVVTSLTQETSPATYNTQLLVPFPNANGQTRKLMVTFRGAGYMAPCQYWESIQPNVQGSAIVSMQTAPSTPDATFLQQSVIGGPSGTAGFTGTFANTHLTIKDMSVWCPAYTNIKALDLGVLSGCYLDGYSSNIFAPANNTSGATAAHPYLADFPAQGLFQSSIGVGILFPRGGNNDAVAFGSICVEGYEVGIDGLDHLTGHRYAGLYCDVIMRCPNVGQSHEVTIPSVSAEQYNGGIRVTGSGGSALRLNIGWDGEVASPVYDISDGSNIATGVVRWFDLDRTAPTVSGASALKVINDRLGPGHWSGAPAAPASTVSQQNTAWRDAWITLSATTGITVITVDGTTTGLTAGNGVSVSIRVPSGKSYAVTYTGTLTTTWWLD